MCWDIPFYRTMKYKIECFKILCYVCWNKIGLICGSTDMIYNDKDVVVCGVCYDMNTDRIITEVLEGVV